MCSASSGVCVCFKCFHSDAEIVPSRLLKLYCLLWNEFNLGFQSAMCRKLPQLIHPQEGGSFRQDGGGSLGKRFSSSTGSSEQGYSRNMAQRLCVFTCLRSANGWWRLIRRCHEFWVTAVPVDVYQCFWRVFCADAAAVGSKAAVGFAQNWGICAG